MELAAIIGTHAGYLMLAFLPPFAWLLFYLREDRHPEPKRLLFGAFAGGMAAAALAVVAEITLLGRQGLIELGGKTMGEAFLLFLVIALIEEYAKYVPVKLLIEWRRDFDEPVDAMIYMMTSALGFAALENALFIIPILSSSIPAGLAVTANRFLGANLLHALTSGLVGFFLSRAWFHPHRRHFVALGVALASLLHAVFNTLILIRDGSTDGTWYVVLLLAVMAMMVLIDFERLKKKS